VGCGRAVTITIAGPGAAALVPGRYEIELVYGDHQDSCAFDLTGPNVPRCEDGAAEFWPIRDSGGYTLEVSLPRLTPASLTLIVRYQGTIVVEEHFEPSYAIYYPNGNNCSPTCGFWSQIIEVDPLAGPT
jgi:hypothetical protein